ncbi:hypothetical protein KFL_002250170 [Klebsormidium nitens]|uniref:Protease Do-like 5, chloroplastic n=1 Tax=Klebsormidium nitens TaxID=105231 RepID=A0A1Y1I955_KLENI|nr:hypothetical protein KFL_002250170 [Klebsormidium nitens]|eukprot:GAQ85237.1 hypothetical protein KFL_002250170 [Klebsormidium nitens]
MATTCVATTCRLETGGMIFRRIDASIPCAARLAPQLLNLAKGWQPFGWIKVGEKGRKWWARRHHSVKHQRRRADQGTCLILPAMASVQHCMMKGQTCKSSKRTRDSRVLESTEETALGGYEERGSVGTTDLHLNRLPFSWWWWHTNREASWTRAAFSALTAFLLLLGTLETPAFAAAAAAAPVQKVPELIVTLREENHIRKVLSELSVAEMPEAGSPDVGQTSLFSAENEDLAADLFEKLSPSVVSIQDFKLAPLNRNGRGNPPEPILEGQGSGFVWDSYGHIVTNYHVVAKLATDPSGRQRCKVTVKGHGKTTTVYDATLVGADSNRDIAVLKIDASPTELQPLPIGTSADLRVGQSCYAIGNPFGFGQTLTTGVVSGLDRMIPSPSGKPIPGAIQTDAAINSGNSGGPLFDSFGRLIGVNTATFTRQGSGQSSGVNFAIPVDVVYRIVPRLIVYGSLNYENGLKP